MSLVPVEQIANNEELHETGIEMFLLDKPSKFIKSDMSARAPFSRSDSGNFQHATAARTRRHKSHMMSRISQ